MSARQLSSTLQIFRSRILMVDKSCGDSDIQSRIARSAVTFQVNGNYFRNTSAKVEAIFMRSPCLTSSGYRLWRSEELQRITLDYSRSSSCER